MEIIYHDIVLRDHRKSDIDDDIRWNTAETEWAFWDAPWEAVGKVENFDADAFCKKELENLKKPLPKIRSCFEVDTAEGVHIGGCNSYLIDENYEWVKNPKPGQKTNRTVGIDINESKFWGRGLGKTALSAFILYYLDNGIKDIYTQTWSGNVRMVKTAEKLGFKVCEREADAYEVRGEKYDGLTFKLDVEAFRNYIENHEEQNG